MALMRCPRRRSCLLYLLLAQIPTFLIWIYHRRMVVGDTVFPWEVGCTGSKSCQAALRAVGVTSQLTPPPFSMNISSEEKMETHCDDRLQIHKQMMAVFHDVIVDPDMVEAKAHGGEDISGIMKQPEEDEFYTTRNGFLSLYNCSQKESIKKLNIHGDPPHIDGLRNSVQVLPLGAEGGSLAGEALPKLEPDSFVITLTRYEFANVYWTVMDLYDTFLIASYMNRTMANTYLLLLDAHPQNHLDGLFNGVFKRVLRPFDLTHRTRIDTLVTGFARQYSPMLVKTGAQLPIIDHFRSHVLQAYGLTSVSDNVRRSRCLSKSLSVLFIWRRDYVAHPRNPGGKVARKISNENELLSETSNFFPKFKINGVQLDNYTIKEQLAMLADADLFVGMHGAAFGFVTLLSPGSGVLEMWPQYWGANWHMEYLAKRSGLHYHSWRNKHKENEDKNAWLTKVVPSEITHAIDILSNTVCKQFVPT